MDAVVDDSDLSMAIYRSASPETKARIQAQYEEIKAKRTLHAHQRRAEKEKHEAEKKREKKRRDEQDAKCCRSFGLYAASLGALWLIVAVVVFVLGHGIADEYWVLSAWTSVICFVLAAVCYFDLRF